MFKFYLCVPLHIVPADTISGFPSTIHTHTFLSTSKIFIRSLHQCIIREIHVRPFVFLVSFRVFLVSFRPSSSRFSVSCFALSLFTHADRVIQSVSSMDEHWMYLLMRPCMPVSQQTHYELAFVSYLRNNERIEREAGMSKTERQWKQFIQKGYREMNCDLFRRRKHRHTHAQRTHARRRSFICSSISKTGKKCGAGEKLFGLFVCSFAMQIFWRDLFHIRHFVVVK